MLEEARSLGFLGRGPISDHLRHARGFQEAVESSGPVPARAVDLGSGGGVPGLALALAWPTSRWSLVEASQRRSAFLVGAVAELGLEARVEVVAERAESVGRDQTTRGQADLVVARGFGPPAVVAECAAPLLCVGGRLVVSEPPPGTVKSGPSARWPRAGLAPLGLEPVEGEERPPEADTAGGFQVLRQVSPCPSRYPRRTGIPAKRPLY